MGSQQNGKGREKAESAKGENNESEKKTKNSLSEVVSVQRRDGLQTARE